MLMLVPLFQLFYVMLCNVSRDTAIRKDVRLGVSSCNFLLWGTSPFPGCTYTNGKNRNADIYAAIGFQPHDPSFRGAGRMCVAQELINLLECLAATWDWMRLCKPRSREFVKLFSFCNRNLLLIVLREDIWIGSSVVSLRHVLKKLVMFTCLSDLCPGVMEIFNWSLREHFKVRRSRMTGAVPPRLLYVFITL
jgi:hypothetical protein